jgi:hypothetical protein
VTTADHDNVMEIHLDSLAANEGASIGTLGAFGIMHSRRR